MDWERLAEFIEQHPREAHGLDTNSNGMVAYQRKRAEHEKLRKDILRLQQENNGISQRVRELKSDPRAIEREAREQLKYTRPGEVVFTFPEARSQSPTATARKH